MNPVGNTTGKSSGTDLRKAENRQGLLADLRPSSPGPPRAAAVAHQLSERSKGRLFAMRPATPGGHGAGDGQAPSRQEDPLRESSREYRVQALNTGVYARFECLPASPSCLRTMDAVVPLTGLAQEQSPVDGSPGPARTTRQIGATLFDEALEAPFGQAIMASGGESADLLDSLVNRLLSDDYEVYDRQDPNVRALLADYEAPLPDADAPPFGGALEDPSAEAGMASGGESTDPFDLVISRLLSDDYEAYDPEDPNVRALMADYEGTILLDTGAGAPAFGGALEDPSGQASMASGGESADLLDSVMNRLLSDDYEAYDPEDPNVRALMADYEAMILNMGLDTDTAQPAGPSADPDHAREKKRPPRNFKRASSEQRQAILHIFETDPERSNRSIADEFGVSYSTMRELRTQFNKTGNIEPGDSGNRLTGEQRRALLHIFETDPERSNQSLADEFGVSIKTIRALRKQFSKTGNIKRRNSAYRLTDEQRQAILRIFEADPERKNKSLADEFGVTVKTIRLLRERFGKTGDIKAGDRAYRLSDEQRQAILRIFETDPERDSQSLADEFGVNIKTIRILRERFSKTGDIKPGSRAHRLTGEQRRAILHVFETNPKRSIQSLVDEFGVTLKTIRVLRERFRETGDIKRGDHAHRLTDEQRRTILRIFETDPERTSQSIMGEIGVAYSTILLLRKQFDQTGDIKPRDRANRLTDEQRQAILHIFETDPKRKNQSLADEFDVTIKTIRVLRKQFGKTGDIKPRDRTNRLTDEQRQALLRIFATDTQRSIQSLADEFGVSLSTILLLKKQFGKTGDIKPGDCANRLTGDQRRAILHIFKTDPERKNESIADEFSVTMKTIRTLRKRFDKT